MPVSALSAHSYSSSSMKNCNRFFNVISLRGGNEEPALGIVDHYHNLSGTVQIWWLITVDRLLISKDDSCCTYRPQVNDLGQKKFDSLLSSGQPLAGGVSSVVLFHASSMHSGCAAVAQRPLSISDDP
ncbi:hypothetical protein T12_9747 [Trichinella patagoniensis]|uniref:Uncharacterized protein n=1 Tax=Trichinella patagoniensis TaxID=990121 RepID=A0A0V0ZI86_9BILA|nr:hypothetical protein T12_9747 [Trichinella patagoniensis]